MPIERSGSGGGAPALPPRTTRVRATYRVVTPLFLGGASQQAELRAPSVRGALRFWYRAANPRFMDDERPGEENAASSVERRLFGAVSGTGSQSRVLTRVWGSDMARWTWSRDAVNPFTDRRHRYARNGLIYLGFPFHFGRGAPRDAIAPGARVTVDSLVLDRGYDAATNGADRRGLLASLWLLGTFGGLGARCRRGFGGLELEGWAADGHDAEPWRADMGALSVHPESGTLAALGARISAGLAVIEGWLGEWRVTARHPHLGEAMDIRFIPQGHTGRDAFLPALNAAGRELQDFRQLSAPDYQTVKDQISGKGRLQHSPSRSVFGLPLTFRYQSLNGKSETFVPRRAETDVKQPDRHGSLLWIRLVTCADGLHPMFVRLDGAVPGVDPPAAFSRSGLRLGPASPELLDEFMRGVGGWSRKGGSR